MKSLLCGVFAGQGDPASKSKGEEGKDLLQPLCSYSISNHVPRPMTEADSRAVSDQGCGTDPRVVQLQVCDCIVKGPNTFHVSVSSKAVPHRIPV